MKRFHGLRSGLSVKSERRLPLVVIAIAACALLAGSACCRNTSRHQSIAANEGYFDIKGKKVYVWGSFPASVNGLEISSNYYIERQIDIRGGVVIKSLEEQPDIIVVGSVASDIVVDSGSTDRAKWKTKSDYAKEWAGIINYARSSNAYIIDAFHLFDILYMGDSYKYDLRRRHSN